MGHALQKKERWAVGKHSPRDDIARAKDLCRFIRDQIEMMMQYIRGRVGDDRDAILSMQDRPTGLALARRHQRFRRAKPDPRMRRVNVPWSQRRNAQGMTNAQAQCSPSAVTNGSGFTPLTPVADRPVSLGHVR